MSTKKQYCKSCGTELVDPKAKVCSSCGVAIAQPLYKKWWFWVIIGVIVTAISVFAGNGSNGTGVKSTSTDSSNTNSNSKSYEIVDLQQMLDELESNALKAENTYKNKYVQVQGEITSIDSDGYYIRIEPVYASSWNFDTVRCNLKSDTQRDFIMGKSVGDTVTIKGKITSVDDLLGYYISIDDVY